ncbi:MAG: ABC transporter permease [Acidobacteria bacterium]|nr:ABC transporter permease [Acidobacteriota bacterium]
MFWRRSQKDFDDEIRAHLELEAQQLLREGAAPADAYYGARRAFGNVTRRQEWFYEQRRILMVRDFISDMAHGFRQLRLNRSYAALAIVTLALGIGANTALFSVVYAILIKPLPYREPERLARVWMDNRRLQMKEDWASWLNYQDYKKLGTSFESMTAFSNSGANLTTDGEPESILGVRAEAALFDQLGVRPHIGRFFTSEEDVAGKGDVWVIGWGLWQRRFGGSTDVLGKKIEMDGSKATIIGVMPPGFRFPTKETEFWSPLVVPDGAKRRVGYWLQMVGRLKPGATMQNAQTEMEVVGKQLELQYPKENAGYGIYVNPLVNHVVGNTRTPLLLLLGAVGFVLLIACVNVAGLMLSRAEARGREVAVRAALGAGRARLAILMFGEAVALALIAGGVGLMAAWWGVKALVMLAPADLPRLDEIGINLPVFLFGLAVTVLTALLFGMVPAWRIARINLNEALREGGRSVAGSIGGQRTRAILVVAECSLAIMLLAGAGLFLRSLFRLQGVDPGFRTNSVLTMQVVASRTKVAQPPQVLEFHQRLMEKIRGLPGVTGMGSITTLLLSDTPNSGTFTLEDRPPFPEAEQIEATSDIASAEFFKTMQVRLKYGRFFDDRDRMDGPRAAIINATFASKYWPGQDPTGKRFVFGMPRERNPWITIVGVIEDMRRRGLHREARLEVFAPLTQRPARGTQLLIAVNGNPMALAAAVRSEIRALDSLATVTKVSTVEAEVGTTMAARRFQALLLALFAMLALVLAAVGIFGLMYQSVSRRTHEIGVRMALGAQGSDVMGMMLRQGLLLTATGCTIGLAGAFALSRLVRGLLYGVGPADPVTYVAAVLLLAAGAVIACWVPARRATRVDPLVALRHE